MVNVAANANFVALYKQYWQDKQALLSKPHPTYQDLVVSTNNEFNLLNSLATASNFATISYGSDPRISDISLNTNNGYNEVEAGVSLSGCSVSASTAIVAAPGANPVTYILKSGPSWLTLDPSTGDITGTPVLQSKQFNMNNGVYSPNNGNSEIQYIVVDASDSFGNSACGPQTIAITIISALAPSITSSATAAGVHATPFTYNITASNTPTSYSLDYDSSGVLSINTTTGAVTCASLPAAGAYAFTVSATNAYGTSIHFDVTLTVS